MLSLEGTWHRSPACTDPQLIRCAQHPPSTRHGQQGPDAEAKLLDKLRGWFEEKGGDWQPGWRVELKQRTTGKTTGAADVVRGWRAGLGSGPGAAGRRVRGRRCAVPHPVHGLRGNAHSFWR